MGTSSYFYHLLAHGSSFLTLAPKLLPSYIASRKIAVTVHTNSTFDSQTLIVVAYGFKSTPKSLRKINMVGRNFYNELTEI